MVYSLLDDFRDMRLNGDGTNLWQPYLGEGNDGQVSELVGNELRTQTGGGNSNYYMQFFPRDGGYPYPEGFMHHHVRDANYAHTMNVLAMLMRHSISRVNSNPHGDLIQFGTYIKDHQNGNISTQGAHFYHYANPRITANRWRKYWWDDKPQTQVGSPGEYPPDPLFATHGEHYFHAMTRFYIDHQPLNQGWGDHRVDLAAPHLLQIDGEPRAYVSSVNGGYDGQRYDWDWCTPRNSEVDYEVRYSDQSMKVNGFESGEDGGLVEPTGDTYVNVGWQSPLMSEVNPGFFIAIRPVGQSTFVERFIPYNLGPHNAFEDGSLDSDSRLVLGVFL